MKLVKARPRHPEMTGWLMLGERKRKMKETLSTKNLALGNKAKLPRIIITTQLSLPKETQLMWMLLCQ